MWGWSSDVVVATEFRHRGMLARPDDLDSWEESRQELSKWVMEEIGSKDTKLQKIYLSHTQQKNILFITISSVHQAYPQHWIHNTEKIQGIHSKLKVKTLGPIFIVPNFFPLYPLLHIQLPPVQKVRHMHSTIHAQSSSKCLTQTLSEQ